MILLNVFIKKRLSLKCMTFNENAEHFLNENAEHFLNENAEHFPCNIAMYILMVTNKCT